MAIPRIAINGFGRIRRTGILSYCDDPLVSSDIIGNSYSCIFDAGLTQAVQKGMVKVVGWHDNEWGYSTPMEELIGRLAIIVDMQWAN